MLNTYREAVRARILHGLFALSVCSALYALVVAQYASKNALRVVSDVGSATISVFAIVVAIVMGATGLYRELELKTVFPILARPLSRGQYLLGKYLGTVLTLAVFVAADSAVLMLSLRFIATESALVPLLVLLGCAAVALIAAQLWKEGRTHLPLLLAPLLLVVSWALGSSAPDDRLVVLSAAILSVLEVAIVSAIALLFSSFSSPFLTALFTFGVFLVGRSADALAKLPERVFGSVIHEAGVVLSQVFPNLMVYVPPRPLLSAQVADVPLAQYLLLAAGQSLAWSVGLLVVAGVIFNRRDFL
jgi:ABC-type transport system involved in multi-copper enzyme maturation permease subunit